MSETKEEKAKRLDDFTKKDIIKFLSTALDWKDVQTLRIYTLQSERADISDEMSRLGGSIEDETSPKEGAVQDLRELIESNRALSERISAEQKRLQLIMRAESPEKAAELYGDHPNRINALYREEFGDDAQSVEPPR